MASGPSLAISSGKICSKRSLQNSDRFWAIGGVRLHGFDLVRQQTERPCAARCCALRRSTVGEEVPVIRWRGLIRSAASAGVVAHAQIVEDQAHMARELVHFLRDAAPPRALITPMAKRRSRVMFSGP